MKRNALDAPTGEQATKDMKRDKADNMSTIRIEDLNNQRARKLFKGDVLVTYKANLLRTQKQRHTWNETGTQPSQPAQQPLVATHSYNDQYIFHAELTDIKCEMTVTLVPHDFIAHHEEKLQPSKAKYDRGDCPKTKYDRGDCAFILQVNA